MKDFLAIVAFFVAIFFFWYFTNEGYFVQAFWYGIACALFAYHGSGRSDTDV
jgi:hypothetical protein